MGETWADLKCKGKEPSVSDKVIIYVIGLITLKELMDQSPL